MIWERERMCALRSKTTKSNLIVSPCPRVARYPINAEYSRCELDYPISLAQQKTAMGDTTDCGVMMESTKQISQHTKHGRVVFTNLKWFFILSISDWSLALSVTCHHRRRRGWWQTLPLLWNRNFKLCNANHVQNNFIKKTKRAKRKWISMEKKGEKCH